MTVSRSFSDIGTHADQIAQLLSKDDAVPQLQCGDGVDDIIE